MPSTRWNSLPDDTAPVGRLGRSVLLGGVALAVVSLLGPGLFAQQHLPDGKEAHDPPRPVAEAPTSHGQSKAIPQPAQDGLPRIVAQLGHSEAIISAAFSPDGRWVLTGSHDTSAKLWETATGMEIRRFEGHTAALSAVAFSPDGRWVLTGSRDKTARLWETATGQEVRRFEGHTMEVNAVAFSPDGRWVLTGSQDATARLWDRATGTEVRRFEGHTMEVNAVAFSPDGRWVLTGSDDKTARLWEAATGKEVRDFEGHMGYVLAVAFSPDGHWVLTGSGSSFMQQDFSARLWETATGKEVRRFEGHTYDISMVAFSPDGALLLTGDRRGDILNDDKTARLWETATGKEVRRFKAQRGRVAALAFSPDGRSVLLGDYDAAGLWETATGKEVRRFEGHTGSVTSLAFSSDGRWMMTGSSDGNAHLWEAPTGREIRRFNHGLPVDAVAFSPDSQAVLTGGWDKVARLWQLSTGKEVRRFEGHSTNVSAVAFSPDGRWVLTGSGSTLVFRPSLARLWDVATGKEVRRFEGHTDGITAAAFAPDGRWVLTGSKDLTARLWETATGKEVRRFQGHTNQVRAVAFSPDGRYVLTGSGDPIGVIKLPQDLSISVRDLLDPKPGPSGKKPSAPVTGGSLQIVDNTARLWETETGKEIRRFEGHSDIVNAVAISPDGRWVLTGSRDKTARLWELATGKEVRLFEGNAGKIRGATFSPDGRRVFTASEDGTARFWEVATGKPICQLVGFRNGSWAVVDSEGRYDASNGGDVAGLHWVVGNESIGLKQLKERYYDPGLLAKYMGFNKEPLRKVEAFRHVKLFPEAVLAEIKPGDKNLTLELTNRGGGIGRVQVLVNGKELLADARGPKPDPDAKKVTLTVDLSGAHFVAGQPNQVEIVTWNGEGYLSSRGLVGEFPGPSEAAAPIQLYAIVAGVGTYDNPALNLRFAAKDAEDFATALQLGAKRLFGAEQVHLSLLTSSDHPLALKPTKENVAQAFVDLKKTQPGDVVVVYLAGHGVALRQGSDLYCYLTADARSLDLQTLADPAVRAATTVSSEDLTAWIKQIPALKQVMVLDTCAAGAAAVKLTEKRDVSGDQVRAIERLKDRTGFHVLMGCSADRVSYEASQYAQGLLTYALLEGMCGAALQKDNVDVSRLFQYAADRVPELARNIGGVQRPLVAAPRGTSFDVGRLEAEDRAKVPLARVKPLVLRPTLLNQDEADDNLKLTALLRQRLSDASQPAGRGQHSAIVYVPEDEFPGAVRPTGIYTVEGDKVSVRLTLKRDSVVMARLTVEGSKEALPTLADKMARAVLEAAK